MPDAGGQYPQGRKRLRGDGGHGGVGEIQGDKPRQHSQPRVHKRRERKVRQVQGFQRCRPVREEQVSATPLLRVEVKITVKNAVLKSGFALKITLACEKASPVDEL